MKYRQLGNKGPTVSALGLGCMGMSASYGPIDDNVSLKVIQRAYDEGITFFDTADMYGNGANETLLSDAIRPFREKVVIATKCAIKSVNDEWKIDNTPQYIKKACEASLMRLGIEVIDLYYLHRYNPEVPVQESMQAMLELLKEGKIRYVGLSEVKPEVLKKAHEILGDKLVAVQSEFSIVNPRPIKKILSSCRQLGVSIIPYSPLGRGLLSGKFRDAKMFSETSAVDYRALLPQFQPAALATNLRLVQDLDIIAQKKHCSTAQLALAWLLAQGDDIIPIPGTKRLDYPRGKYRLIGCGSFR